MAVDAPSHLTNELKVDNSENVGLMPRCLTIFLYICSIIYPRQPFSESLVTKYQVVMNVERGDDWPQTQVVT